MKKLLIANRGEIAVRIARAAQELGIATVAVASEADRGALHTRVADEVALIGPPPARESYLAQGALLDVARAHGCDAVHPGYGFLAQNAEFAERVEAAGLIWVGPPGSAIRLMGDKTAARRSMRAAGVPIVPGFEPAEGAPPPDDEALLAEAERIGLPLMVKAAAGGGGRGMRVARAPGEVAEALSSARREAEKAFGDGRLFLERYVEDARHIEIQVLADRHGGCLHLLERECSIQRRHQKIVEEAPSPLLDDTLRARMGAAAVAAALACGYVNAGTIEFLVGKDPAAPGGLAFYFLEMNTRIQVEHPVTECVTGLDIVRWQLEIAAGKPVPIRQEDVRPRGHAIECRLNAEDPAADFAPSTGTLALAAWPEGPGVRVDRGYDSGDAVPIHYDNLLGKVIVHAEDRAAAIRRMEEALRRTSLLGVETNQAYLGAILAHPVFRAGEATTAFVAKELPGWKPPGLATASDAALIALALAEVLAKDARGPERAAGGGGAPADGDPHGPWGRRDGFRIGAPGGRA